MKSTMMVGPCGPVLCDEMVFEKAIAIINELYEVNVINFVKDENYEINFVKGKYYEIFGTLKQRMLWPPTVSGLS